MLGAWNYSAGAVRTKVLTTKRLRIRAASFSRTHTESTFTMLYAASGLPFRFRAWSHFVWAFVALTASAPAAITTQTVNHQITAVPDGPNQFFDLDVDQNGTTDFTFRAIIGLPDEPSFASFADIQPQFGTLNGVVIDAFTGDGFPTVSRLQVGDVVSAAGLYSGNNDLGNLSSQFFPDAPTGNFQNMAGYIGFQFENLGNTFYGFAQISVNDLLGPQDPLAVFIGTVSYEDTAGKSITVSAVPEPATAILLALGSAVFSCRRIRNRIFVKSC